MSKRNNHSYKVKDYYYRRAKKRAIKEKGTLANLIELVVIGYGSGLDVKLLNVDGSLLNPEELLKPMQ